MHFVEKLAPHPTAKVNFLPRMLAAYSFLLCAWGVAGDTLLSPSAIFVLFGGLVWPWAAYLLSGLKGTKKQEVINMHVDALLTGSLCLIAPNQIMIFSVIIVLFSNSIFTGSFRLLATTGFTLFAVLLTGFVGLDISWVQISQKSQAFILSFLVIYFSFFALMGYNVMKKFLKLNREVKILSVTDPLTGCFNRLYLDMHLAGEVRRCMRMHYPCSIIFADIDHFKALNDEFGHDIGDEILKIFVQIIGQSIRKEVDWIARFGGEEFIIVLTDSDSESSAKVAERIRHNVEQHRLAVDDKEVTFTCSFGVTGLDSFEHEVEAAYLLKQADIGLYQAKDKGRNRVERIPF